MNKKLNDYRVFPRLAMLFMMFLMLQFHAWFTQDGTLNVTDINEWALAGYASVMATFVGFMKYYIGDR